MNIQMSSCCSIADMETSTSLVNVITDKSFPDIIADWHLSAPCGNLNYLSHSKKFCLIDWLIDWMLYSTPAHTHQSDAASNRSHSTLLSGRHDAPDFVLSWIRSGLFGGHKSEVHMGGHDQHFWTAGSEWCLVSQGRHSLRKRSRPAESIKNDNVILQHI